MGIESQYLGEINIPEEHRAEYAQQALKLQQEQNKQVRKRRSRARKQTDAKRLYALKQQQKREKHKGH